MAKETAPMSTQEVLADIQHSLDKWGEENDAHGMVDVTLGNERVILQYHPER